MLNPAYASRYNVYLWEIANAGDVVDGVTVLAPTPDGAVGTQLVSYGEAQCGTPTASIPDRRTITSAVINCTANGVNGISSNVPVEKWIKVFLVEPSLNRARTHAGDIYVEVVGESTAGGDELVRHDVPYLIK